MNDRLELDTDRRAREPLEAALRDAGCTFIRGKTWRCNFHDDKNPSAEVYEKDSIWRFKCFGCGICGDVFDIRAKIEGKNVDDLLRDRAKEEAAKNNGVHHNGNAEVQPKIYPTVDDLKAAVWGLEAAYIYTNPQTKKPDLIVLRSVDDAGKKKFIQATPRGDGFSMKGMGDAKYPIYNRIRLATVTEAVVVEGEKCVHVLSDVGIVATTSPGGAGKAAKADWSPLDGKKTVWLWPDHDAPDDAGKRKGHDHMRDVVAELQKLPSPPDIRLIDPDGLGLSNDGSDVVDFLADYEPQQMALAARAALDSSSRVAGTEGLSEYFERIIDGKINTKRWPFPTLTYCTRALMTSTVTLFCGEPGASKSFFMIQCLSYWVEEKYKVAVMMLEDPKEYHLNRALAQASGNGMLADSDWVFEHAQEARDAVAEHRDLIATLAKSIWTPAEAAIGYPRLLAWIEERATAGADIIVIDPVTAILHAGRDVVREDLDFLVGIKRIAVEKGCKIILVTHPRKGSGGSSRQSWDEIAGGASFPRFSQSVLWLMRPDEPEETTVKSPYGMDEATTASRFIKVVKARNAPGTGMKIAFDFKKENLSFVELGIVVPEKK